LPNILTRRLKALVEAGLLERRRYSERPPRDEYVLTQAGRDFRPVLWGLLAWGNKHFAPDGPSVVVVDSQTGEQAEPVLVDRKSGRPLVVNFQGTAHRITLGRGEFMQDLRPTAHSKQLPHERCNDAFKDLGPIP
jgi:hypothetical protein